MALKDAQSGFYALTEGMGKRIVRLIVNSLFNEPFHDLWASCFKSWEHAYVMDIGAVLCEEFYKVQSTFY